jgi:hypothetical protein
MLPSLELGIYESYKKELEDKQPELLFSLGMGPLGKPITENANGKSRSGLQIVPMDGSISAILNLDLMLTQLMAL